MAANGVKVRDWTLVDRGSLVGWAEIEFPSGMIISGIGVFRNAEDQLYAIPPSKPKLGRDGVQIERDGKKQYDRLIHFTSRELSARWSELVIAALVAAGKVSTASHDGHEPQASEQGD